MDQTALVNEGSKLVAWLDQTEVKPRAAMWVYNSETDRWRLWIVPSGEMDKMQFYLVVSEIISEHRAEIPTFDISLVEFKSAKHPAVTGLGQMFHMEGLGAAHVSNNMINGFLLSDGIVLRMAI